jgi:hypothetical protein
VNYGKRRGTALRLGGRRTAFVENFLDNDHAFADADFRHARHP